MWLDKLIKWLHGHKKWCSCRKCSRFRFTNKSIVAFIIVGIGSTLWLLFRSGTKPSRITYPCQKVATSNSVVFLSWLAGILGGHFLYRWAKVLICKLPLFFFLVVIVVSGIRGWGYWQSLQKPQMIQSQTTVSRVVRITNSSATTGLGATYYNNVNQTVVNDMANQAIKALTGQSSVASSWDFLFKRNNQKRGKGNVGYQAGEKIIIKVNFNNSGSTSEQNALPQTVNAFTRQLINDVDISAQNIYVYDVSRNFPDYFSGGLLYGVHQVAQNTNHAYSNLWGSSILNTQISKLVEDADYIINMPLLRGHAIAGVTLSFKNHYGSIRQVVDSVAHNIREANSNNPENPLLVLNRQPFIKDKTVLAVGDGLFAITSWYGAPHRPPDAQTNSLFLSYDPVANDKKMFDYLRSLGTNGAPTWAENYLIQADAQGLGEWDNIDSVVCNPNCSNQSPQPSPSMSPSSTPSRPSPTPTRSPTPVPSATPTPTPCNQLGDIDGNCTVNAADIKLVISSLFSSGNCSSYDCDVNHDNKVNMIDAAFIVRDWGN